MILTVIGWTAAVIGCLLVLVLIAPLRLLIDGWIDSPGRADYTFRVDWALGLVGVIKTAGAPWRLTICGLGLLRLSSPNKKKKEKKKKKTKAGKKSPLAVADIIRQHFQTALTVLSRLLMAIFPEGYIVSRVGLADPADTAKIALLSRMLPSSGKWFEIAFTPVYDEEVIQVDAQAKVTIVLGYIGLTAILLLLQKPTRKMLRSLRHA